jgi:hypothetical protein
MAAGESKVEDYLKRRVKATGGHTRKVRWLDRNGAPDRLIWWTFPNAHLVETKAPLKGIDWQSTQGREIIILTDTGWSVSVINSIEQVDAFIMAHAPKGC